MLGCKHERARRARRRGWQKTLLAWMPLHPYRCTDCGARFWRYDGKPWRDTVIVGVVLGVALGIYWQRQRVVGPVVSLVQVEPTPAPSIVPLKVVPEEFSPEPSSAPVQATVSATASASLTRAPATTPSPVLVRPVVISPQVEITDPPLLKRVDGRRVVGAVESYTLRLWHTAGEPKASTIELQNPNRLVLDLAGGWPTIEQPLPGTREVGQGLVRNIRLGRHRGKLRVVLDLKDPLAYEFSLQSAPNLLELTIHEAVR